MFKFIAFCILSFTFLSGCNNQPLYKEAQVLMGTFIEVTSPDKNAAGIVFDEIRRIDNLLSKYNPESEISKLNKLGRIDAGPDTIFIIKKAIEFWRMSDGAFDITVAPLLDLWGFTDKKFYVPADTKIAETLKLVGSDKILLNETNNIIKFTVSEMKIDLGAIAKGFSLDCAVKRLKENNINSCLINAGGQVYGLGDKYGKPWRIAVKSPRGGNVIDYLELKNKSVSTSGDYEQFFIEGKRRYSHILNPKTGYPADSGVISVTVISDIATTADVLSTAIFVLGKEKAKVLMKNFPDVEAKIIEEKDVSHNR